MLEGHAFIAEAAVSIGGKMLKQGINVYRFANRIPLLFEVTACLPPGIAGLCAGFSRVRVCAAA